MVLYGWWRWRWWWWLRYPRNQLWSHKVHKQSVKHSSEALLTEDYGFGYKSFLPLFCTSSSQRWFPSTITSHHLHWSMPGLFPVGRHESGLSHLHLLRRAETWRPRAANSSTVFLQSFQIHVSWVSERQIGKCWKHTLWTQDSVGSCPDSTTHKPCGFRQVTTLWFPHGYRKGDSAYFLMVLTRLQGGAVEQDLV